MRLIDAENLMTVTDICEDGTEITYVPYSEIESAPTTYDVDKVVAQLEGLTEEECTLHECGIRSERCKPCIAKKAIEIVKGGGIDGN